MLRLRPHHLLCMQRFRGEGYDKTFVMKAWGIVDSLKNGCDMVLVDDEDDLCDSCPLSSGCAGEDGDIARSLDMIVLERTGLELGVTLMSKETLLRVSKTVPSAGCVCHGCPWLELCLEIEEAGMDAN